MIRALWSAATGMYAQQMQTDVVANNLANSSTTGFKKSRANFEDLMYRTMQVAGQTTPGGGQVPTGIQVGMGVKPTSVQKLFTQGDYIQTDNQLDIAIQGNGFFRVRHGDEDLYTRAGNFSLNNRREMISADGNVLMNASDPAQPLVINGSDVKVDKQGIVVVDDAVVGQIRLVRFADRQELRKVGRNNFQATSAAGVPRKIDDVILHQGVKELSNVDPLSSMVGLIEISRQYELQQKIMTSLGDVNRMAATEIAAV